MQVIASMERGRKTALDELSRWQELAQEWQEALSPTAIVGCGAGAIAVVGVAERHADDYGVSLRSRQAQAICDFPLAALSSIVLHPRPEPGEEELPACQVCKAAQSSSECRRRIYCRGIVTSQ